MAGPALAAALNLFGGAASAPGAPISSGGLGPISTGAKVFNSGGNPNTGLVFGGPLGNQLLSSGSDPTSATAAISRNIVPLAFVIVGGMFLLRLAKGK